MSRLRVGKTVPGVRIHFPSPHSGLQRDFARFAAKYANNARISRFCSETGPEKACYCCWLQAFQLFLCRASEQSGFSESIIRMQCDHTKEPYSETVFHRCDEQAQKKAEMRLRKQA